MNLNKISDQIVFKILRSIKHGKLKLINYDNKEYNFGNNDEKLFIDIKVNKPGLTFNIIKSGSIGLAEAYMRGDFETNNLSNLIELTARNIQIVYKFSGLFDFPLLNNLKNIFIKNTINRSKENIWKR